MKTIRRIAHGLAAALALAVSLPGLAQGFPNKPIKMVVPYVGSPGTELEFAL